MVLELRRALRAGAGESEPPRAAIMRAVAARCAALRGFLRLAALERFGALVRFLFAATRRLVAAFCAAVRGFLRLVFGIGLGR